MAALDTFIALRNYVKGKISKYELEESDGYISSVRENTQNRGQSEIRIEFEGEREFLESLGLLEDDVWFYQLINSPYHDYEAVDWYSVIEEFENGWGPFLMFDDENKEKLSIISRVILPIKVNFDDNNYRQELVKKLLTNFKSETDKIISDYQTERNYEIIQSARDSINQEFSDYVERLDLEIYGDGFVTTVANLIMLYLKENKIHLTLKELLESITDNITPPGGWYENIYEYSDDEKFDKESFNNYTSYQLDKIIEKLYDTEDIEGVSIEEYIAMTDRINKKFEIDTYYNLPKDPDKKTRFKIEGFEYPNMKIVVILQKGMKQRKVKLSEENFYNLLYQPTLFDFDEI
jgi:hypothetical protein